MPLAISYGVSGTAGAADYEALPGALVIPAGEVSASIAVNPLPDDLAEGDETVVVTLQSGSDYHTPPVPMAALTLKDLPFDEWRAIQFGPDANDDAISGELADPDRDHVLNVIEYATGGSGLVGNADPVMFDVVSAGADRFLRVTVPKNPLAADVSFQVQASSNVADPGGWSGAGLIVEEDTATILRVRDSVPMAPGMRRFMRLQVSK
jgi:hypothetical protein